MSTRCAPTRCVLSSRSAAKTSVSRSAVRCCRALGHDNAERGTLSRISAGVLAVALTFAAATPAIAVSGGGKSFGVSEPIDSRDFSGEDLRGVRFTKASARETIFSGANMSGVSLFAIEAIRAKFVATNLSGATLELGNFEQADFTNAILEGAFVQAASFKGAVLTGSDWTDVILRKDQQAELCGNKTAQGVNPTTGVDTRESMMCPPK